MSDNGTVMEGVREYAWEEPVNLCTDDNGRLVVEAHDGDMFFLHVDLRDLLKWLAENLPELIPEMREREAR